MDGPKVTIPNLATLVMKVRPVLIAGRLPARGNGYLAGTYPGGITTVDGVPVKATVRVLYRPASDALGDGAVVAEVQSAVDGTWRVDGLDPSLKFDVVGRKLGFNDVIAANVSPKVD